MPDLADGCVESLGEIVETCLNYAEYGTKSTSGGFESLPPQMRIDALSNGLDEVKTKILALYTELGGEDVWNA